MRAPQRCPDVLRLSHPMTRATFLATRRSLVEKLGNWNDQRKWQEFFDTYAKLIHSTARKAGLTDAESQEVVQETLITVAKNIDGLKYDPAVGSFKGWLLNITRWRIGDQFRKRKPGRISNNPATDNTRRTATIDRIADPAGFDLAAAWDAEWQANLLHAATKRVKKKVDPKQYQIFDCYVLKEWPVRKVASELSVSIAQVYLAKHRVSALLKKEIGSLERANP